MEEQKKEYISPELTVLGEFSKVTQYSTIGDPFDGGFPDSIEEAFGS